jgi:hypothetical protein
LNPLERASFAWCKEYLTPALLFQRNTKKKSVFKPSQLKVFGSPEPFFQKGFWPPEAEVMVDQGDSIFH